MALTEEQYQQLIVAEVGDDASGALATTAPVYWARYAGIDDLETRFLYAKRDAIDLMLGRVRQKVDVQAQGGVRKSQSQLFGHLTIMRAAVQEQIDSGSAALSAGGASGELTTTAPVMPPAGSLVDANDRAYRGDVYRRSVRR